MNAILCFSLFHYIFFSLITNNRSINAIQQKKKISTEMLYWVNKQSKTHQWAQLTKVRLKINSIKIFHKIVLFEAFSGSIIKCITNVKWWCFHWYFGPVSDLKFLFSGFRPCSLHTSMSNPRKYSLWKYAYRPRIGTE